MAKRISLYVTPSHVSITIENGATREATARSLDDAIAALHPADVEPLRALALSIADILGTVAAARKLEGGQL